MEMWTDLDNKNSGELKQFAAIYIGEGTLWIYYMK
jgi:hypothetical protein